MRARNILIIDDDHVFRSLVRKALSGVYRLIEVADEAEFRREFRPYYFDLVILDMRLKEGREGLDLLREIRDYDELQPVIMVSAYGDTDATLDAIESGALMFLHKQEFSPELLARLVESLLQQGRIQRRLSALEVRLQQDTPSDFIGISQSIRQAAQAARRAADEQESWVLAVGEPGSGRKQTARVVHDHNRRRVGEPLVIASLRGLSAADMITALFGSIKVKGGPRQKGLIERANGGVLYLGGLDVIAEEIVTRFAECLRQRSLALSSEGMRIPIDLQLVVGVGIGGLERVSWLHSVSPAGRSLEVFLPTLRERKEDIPLLIAYFLQGMRQAGQTTARAVSKSVVALMEAHHWPGNVLELRNAIEFAAIRAEIGNDDELRPEHLPANLLRCGEASTSATESWNYREHIAHTELWLANRAIEELGLKNIEAIAKGLKYNDRFICARHMRKHLTEFPAIGPEFPRAAELFNKGNKDRR